MENWGQGKKLQVPKTWQVMEKLPEIPSYVHHSSQLTEVKPKS
jgi:hypothetical protein